MATATMRRPCPARDCKALLQTHDRFLCQAHWRKLPLFARHAVWAAYREWEARPTMASVHTLRAAQHAALELLP